MQHMLRYEEIEMTVKLPEPLIRGTTSSRCISDFMRPREPEYEKMFEGSLQGLEHLGHFYVAPFQRPAVWTDDQKRKLVESVHLGISIGSIVVSAEGKEDKTTGRFPISADLIIDGQQRMRAIKAYREEGLRIFVGTEHEHSWEELDRVQRRRFESVSVGYIQLDEFDMDSLREIYNRLNFGGTAHTEDQRA